ncbi:MAG: OmpA family protein [Chlorobi bacterium]|nr:OmpA family protein [Chlorobiota bacterium]
MKRSIHIHVLVTVFILMGSSMDAQREPGSLYLSTGGGFSAIGSSFDAGVLNGIDNATWAPQAFFEMGFYPFKDISLSLGSRYGNIEGERMILDEPRRYPLFTNFITASLNVKYSLSRFSSTFVPYLYAGGGSVFYKHKNDPSFSTSLTPFYEAGFGVEFFMTKSASISMHVMSTLITADEFDGFTSGRAADGYSGLNASFTYYFDRSPAMRVGPIVRVEIPKRFDSKARELRGGEIALTVSRLDTLVKQLMKEQLKRDHENGIVHDTSKMENMPESVEAVSLPRNLAADQSGEVDVHVKDNGFGEVAGLQEASEFQMMRTSGNEVEIRMLRPEYNAVRTVEEIESTFARAKKAWYGIPLRDRAGKHAVWVIADVYFRFASSALTTNATVTLKNVVEVLKEHPTLKVQIRGHSCDKGAPHSNMLVSLMRAHRVGLFLRESGIDRGRMLFLGFGSVAPIVPGSAEENRKMNRRVDILFMQSTEAISHVY